MSAPGLVVGTAGHIDHGKTSLVRALTGVDLDTLPEEQERGITITLHFTRLDLPDGRRVAFVDVPGHEKLVRTMVAGATGIDAVLLCVSAVDGVMPQTREHLAILDLLGLRHGLVVLTMADLVDEELLELAAEDVRDTVRGTFLEGAPVLPFSSVDGRGREGLLAALAALPDTERAPEGPFRLPVDRAFSRPGFGTVVTGTAWSGTLPDGATVDLLPERVQARVRGIEVHGERVATVAAGRRVALNLAGLETHQVPRGTVVALGPVACASMIDVRYRHLPGAPALEDGASVRVLHGTAERQARLILTEGDTLEPGRSTFAQLRLDEPLPCLPGDRFVVRRQSPLETLGGGTLLDPWAPRLRHRDRARHLRELTRLERGDHAVLLERAGEDGLTRAQLGERGLDPSRATLLGDRYLAAPVVERLQVALLEALATFHQENPLALGAHRRELRRERLAHLGDRVFDALVDTLAGHAQVEVDGPLVRIARFRVALTPAQVALRERLVAAVVGAGLDGRTLKQLAEAEPSPEVGAVVRLLETAGKVREVAGVGFVEPGLLEALEKQIRAWFADHDALSPQDFKELTGLSRKSAIPLLEWLDKQRLTRRDGDRRVRGPAFGG